MSQKSCLSAWFVEAEESAAHIVAERQSEVRFVGAVSAEAKFSCCSLPHSAGAGEVTKALAATDAVLLVGVCQPDGKLRVQIPITEHCALSSHYSQ